jgi:hypothetical protein
MLSGFSLRFRKGKWMECWITAPLSPQCPAASGDARPGGCVSEDSVPLWADHGMTGQSDVVESAVHGRL